MNYSNRIFLYGPLVLLLLIAAAVMVNWKFAADSFDARLAVANGREITPGVRMSYTSKEMEGFPFRVDSVMDGFTLQVQMRTGPLVWHAEHFAIHALTYGRNQQVFEAAGKQTLWWTDSEGVHRVFTFVPGSLRASAILADGRLSRFDLDAVGINSPELFATRLQFHLRRDPVRDALDFAVSGDDVRDEGSGSAPGHRVGRQLSLSGSLAPVRPLESLLGGEMDWREAAEIWRRFGGVVALDHLDTAKGGLRSVGAGQFSLDGLHRWNGQMSLSFVSWRPVSKPQFFTILEGKYCNEAIETFRPRPDKVYRLTYVAGDGRIMCKVTSPYTEVDEERAAPPPGSFTLTLQVQPLTSALSTTARSSNDELLTPLY